MPLILSVILLFQVPALVLAAVLDLNTYVAEFIEKDENVAIAKTELEAAKIDLKASELLYDSALTIAPELNHSDQTFEQSNISLYERNSFVAAELTQQTPWGLELGVSGLERLEKSNNVTGRTDSAWSLNLTQELWQNAFGKLDRKKSEKARKVIASSSSNLIAAELKSCVLAAEKYFQAYLFQEKVALFSDLQENAETVWKQTRSSYNKRLLKKIDLLSANADFLDLQTKKTQSELEHKNALAELFVAVAKNPPQQETQLQEPQFDLLPGTLLNLKNNHSLMALSHQLAKDQVELDIQKQESVSSLSLGVELGKNTGQVLVGGTLNDFEDQFLNLKLTWQLPIYSPSTHNAEIAKAKVATEISRYKEEQKKKELKKDWLRFFQTYQSNLGLLKSSTEKSQIYQEQVKEARRLLRFGKIEIEDYLNFRDRYLEEQVANLDLRWKVWQAQLKMSEINHRRPAFCGGGIKNGKDSKVLY